MKANHSPSFYEWRLPKVFFYFFVIVLLLQWLAVTEEYGKNFHWIISALLILHVLFFIQGLSLIAFLLKQKKKHGVAGTGGFVGVVSPGFLCYFADGDD